MRTITCGLALLVTTIAFQSRAGLEAEAPTSFEITTEIGMPNLEENLRYTITHRNACLTREALYHLFPILDQPALAGCRLGARSQGHAGISYPLVCQGNHGTSGGAVWTLNGQHSTGTLSIKLGGKNMTFFERVSAISRGGCQP